jgi:hypothetical protein
MLLALLLAAAPGLPADIVLKTETQTFGATHEFAILDGRIWWRARGKKEWALLPPDGLPAPKGRLEALKELTAELPLAPQPFERPKRVVRLSADGDNLISVSDEGRIHYTKVSTLEWTDVWGPPALKGPLEVKEVLRGLAMSHRKTAYEDIDGNPHPVSAGVTTLYALSKDGRSLTFADPWLPPKFDHALCLPRQGAMIAAALAASASTIFVMDESGRSYTRLADFDTLGQDPALPYSYAREKRRGVKSVVRTLPAEDWKEQPKIPGAHTTRITIVQTGEGKAARELRVEGEDGYWSKPIDAAAWKFESRPGLPKTAPRAVANATVDGPTRPVVTKPAANAGITAALGPFDPLCPPTTLTLAKGNDTVKATLHWHPTIDGRLVGAVLAPEKKNALAREIFGAKAFVEIWLEVDADEIELHPLLPGGGLPPFDFAKGN